MTPSPRECDGLKECICADPENCAQPIPGRLCKRQTGTAAQPVASAEAPPNCRRCGQPMTKIGDEWECHSTRPASDEMLRLATEALGREFKGDVGEAGARFIDQCPLGEQPEAVHSTGGFMVRDAALPSEVRADVKQAVEAYERGEFHPLPRFGDSQRKLTAKERAAIRKAFKRSVRLVEPTGTAAEAVSESDVQDIREAAEDVLNHAAEQYPDTKYPKHARRRKYAEEQAQRLRALADRLERLAKSDNSDSS